MEATQFKARSTSELAATYGKDAKPGIEFAPGAILLLVGNVAMDWSSPDGLFAIGDPVYVKIVGGKMFEPSMTGNSVFVTCLQDGECFKLNNMRSVIVGKADE